MVVEENFDSPIAYFLPGTLEVPGSARSLRKNKRKISIYQDGLDLPEHKLIFARAFTHVPYLFGQLKPNQQFCLIVKPQLETILLIVCAGSEVANTCQFL